MDLTSGQSTAGRGSSSSTPATAVLKITMAPPQKPDPRESEDNFRDKHPSGWLVLAKNDSVARMIDALLDLPPHREFNQSDLADVSRQSVNNHLDLLYGVGIIEEVEHTSPQRYRFNPNNPVSEVLINLDGAMNAAGPDPHA